MNLLSYSKEIYDPIHGYIKLSKIACHIIDTYHFQRLRYLHQLGTCHYVFPTASHTRFEHSIGTYFLAGKVLDHLKNNSNHEIINENLSQVSELKNYISKIKEPLKLDNLICELVKIAALCHDLGHGPFSHVFDDVFIKNLPDKYKLQNKSNLESHEVRSCEIIKFIIKSDSLLNEIINDELIKFICDMINPSQDKNNFIYQIVSNNFNSVDVDKFDYIARDTYFLGLKYSIDISRIIEEIKIIDNKICYPEKINYEIISLFKTRYRLHKQIYCHKAVVAIQFMFSEIMLLLNDLLEIYNSMFDINKFSDLTDNYIIENLKFLHKNENSFNNIDKLKIEKAYQIWININERKLYKCTKSITSDTPISHNEVDDDSIIFSSKIGFVSGSKNNPLDNLYFYNMNNSNTCFKINREKMSYLIPPIYQEYVYLFFEKR